MGPLGEANDFATFLCGLVRENTGASDVRGFDRVWIGIYAALQHFDKLINEVRVRTTVACTLGEGKMLLAAVATINTTRGEELDFFRKVVSEVGAGDFFGDFRLGLFRGVHDQWTVLDERPLDGFFLTIDLEGFAVLACDIEERTIEMSGDIAVLELDVRGLDGIG